MEELKNCPFCGWEAELVIDTESDYDPYNDVNDTNYIAFVKCFVCGARTKSFYLSGNGNHDSQQDQEIMKRAVLFWNRRLKDGNG